MAKYRYIGPGPIEVISGGELVKPNDVREFDAEPDWGLWELTEEPEAAPAPQSPPVILAAPLAAPEPPKGM